MRILHLAVMACVLGTPVWAGPPTEVTPATTISIGIGQTRVYRFDGPIARVNVLTKDTVEAIAQTDRQISVTGIAAGETQMFVYGEDRNRLFDALIIVTPEPGHLVKIYGTGKNDDANAGHIAVYCNEWGCGRPDKDLPRPNITVERVSRGPKDK